MINFKIALEARGDFSKKFLSLTTVQWKFISNNLNLKQFTLHSDLRDDTQFYFSLAGNIIVVQIKVEGFRDVDGHPRPTVTQASTSRQ